MRGTAEQTFVRSFFLFDDVLSGLFTLSLHDALPILFLVLVGEGQLTRDQLVVGRLDAGERHVHRSEEHTSELQSLTKLVCRLLLEKKNRTSNKGWGQRSPTQ